MFIFLFCHLFCLNKEKKLFDTPCTISYSNSSTTSKLIYNKHLRDLQHAINQDKITKLTEDGLYGSNTDNALKKCIVKNFLILRLWDIVLIR